MHMSTLTSVVLAAAPAFALAAGDHAGGHAGHDMGAMVASTGGHLGDPAKVTRTIDVAMSDDMRFAPDSITVKAGETVRFFVRNNGRLAHEMVLGSMQQLKEHAEMMRKMPGMQHAESNMVALKPGQRGAIVWNFERAGTVNFACTVPGHMEAGMIARITVED